MNSEDSIIERLSRHDPTLKYIELYSKDLIDADFASLVDCLIAHPDVVESVSLDGNRLTDETGVKLAQYVAASSTIEYLDLSDNRLGLATYLAMANALRANSSLNSLYLYNNNAVDRSHIDVMFIEALRLNPHRPAKSDWYLYTNSIKIQDFARLKKDADELGHPILQTLLTDKV